MKDLHPYFKLVIIGGSIMLGFSLLIQLLPLLIIISPILIIIAPFIIYKYIKNKNKSELDDITRIVTHYCPNCGLLLNNKNSKYKFCTLCGTPLKDGQNNVTLKYNPLEEANKDNIEWITEYFNELYTHQEAYKNLEATNNPEEKLIAYKKYMSSLDTLTKYTPEAFVELAREYALGERVERNYVLVQKYLEQAAQLNSGEAYGFLTAMYSDSKLKWTKFIPNVADGSFKSAIRGWIPNINYICTNYDGLPPVEFSKELKEYIPCTETRLLWWYVRAAELGSADAVANINKYCNMLMEKLNKFNQNAEAQKLYKSYEKLSKYWTEQEPHLRYPDSDCYEAYLAEQKGDLEKALALYTQAAERDIEQAIEAVRRLTGNKNYKLKTGRLQSEDYQQYYQKTQTLFENGDYENCLIQARKTMEIYIHNLYFQKKLDFPPKADLQNLIDTLKTYQVIDDNMCNTMHFIRRKGNSAVHTGNSIDASLASQVIDALTKIVR